MTKTIFRILAWLIIATSLIMIALAVIVQAGFQNLMISLVLLIIGMLLLIVTKK